MKTRNTCFASYVKGAFQKHRAPRNPEKTQHKDNDYQYLYKNV